VGGGGYGGVIRDRAGENRVGRVSNCIVVV